MCTRVVYLGPAETIITGRTMDWKNRHMGSNLWALPRGMERNGAAGVNSITWKSKHGSLVTTCFDSGSADGMNEVGLVANMLNLTETKYPTPSENDPRKPLALSTWLQYVLDNYATVKEAVEELRKEQFYVVPNRSPDYEITKAEGTTHLAISDPTGDSAIFEYIEGKLNIYHSREYQVMTNSPTYDQQLTLNRYWEQIGGTVMLPGTNRASDRFVRASFYINAIPQTDNINEAIAGVFSVIRNISVPLGISTKDEPDISSTLWRVVADHKNKRYFFESTRSLNVFWVNLSKLNFTEGAPTTKLTLTDDCYFAGDVAEEFKPSLPFQFLPAK